MTDNWSVGSTKFTSRLLVGTGKYKDFEETKACVAASGAEIVTMAVRRVNLSEKNEAMLQEYIDPNSYTYLPNTAGCYNAKEAVRTLRLARELGGWNLVKLEVLGDSVTLYPDMIETLKATEILVEDGFEVMVYCTDDLLLAKRLETMGCKAIMPLAAPIGSGLGILNPFTIKQIVDACSIPVLVDAGIGKPSDAALAMELGCDAVLVNSAIAHAKSPIDMAHAMKHAVVAGRMAYLAGTMPAKNQASPSSPVAGVMQPK